MRRFFVALSSIVLAGCPATWGFAGRVAAQRGDLQVIAVTHGSQMSSDALAPVPGAKITCDGCAEPIALDRDGQFRVQLGTQYAAPAPIVLHVQADGYEPMELEVPRSPIVSQSGAAAFVIVLKPKAR